MRKQYLNEKNKNYKSYRLYQESECLTFCRIVLFQMHGHNNSYSHI